MICPSCGRQNPFEASCCSFCGAALPPKQGGNGFSDILSFTSRQEPPAPAPVAVPVPAEESRGRLDGMSRQLKSMQLHLNQQRRLLLASLIIAMLAIAFGLFGTAASITAAKSYQTLVRDTAQTQPVSDGASVEKQELLAELSKGIDALEQKNNDLTADNEQLQQEVKDIKEALLQVQTELNAIKKAAAQKKKDAESETTERETEETSSSPTEEPQPRETTESAAVRPGSTDNTNKS